MTTPTTTTTTATGTGAAGRQRLGVIFGGHSPEHEVSVVSARSILREADPDRFEVVPFGITRGGAWLTPAETERRLAHVEAGETAHLGDDPDDDTAGGGLLTSPDVLAALAAVDVCFPIVHGRGGEDGTLQGLLESAGLPYVGSGVAGSAVGMDKAHMRAAFAAHHIPQPRYAVLCDAEVARPAEQLLRSIEHEVGYPCFVKPANGGSSIGVTKAASREHLGDALHKAGRFDRKVLVEEAIVGREVECAVLGNDEPLPSPLGEIRPREEFYSYEAKYEERGTELIVPAGLPANAVEQVQQYAVTAFRAVDCAGLARVDFFVTVDDKVRIIELNTLPGFTPISMFPRLWEHAGVPYRALITQLVEFGIERHEREAAYA